MLFGLVLNLHKLCIWGNIGFVIIVLWLVLLESSMGLYSSVALFCLLFSLDKSASGHTERAGKREERYTI
jgi:hypothetical protein